MEAVHKATGPGLEARAPIQDQSSQGAPGTAPASDIPLPRDGEGPGKGLPAALGRGSQNINMGTPSGP